MPAIIAQAAALAILAAGPADRPFCIALHQAAEAAAYGFATVRGPLDPGAHTRSFDVYRARVALPDAVACSVTVPHGAGLGPASYACEFAGGVDVDRAMARIARRAARCARVGIANPPKFKKGPVGPLFGFADAARRYALSAVKTDDRTWTVTLAVTPGPHRPRRPQA